MTITNKQHPYSARGNTNIPEHTGKPLTAKKLVTPAAAVPSNEMKKPWTAGNQERARTGTGKVTFSGERDITQRLRVRMDHL